MDLRGDAAAAILLNVALKKPSKGISNWGNGAGMRLLGGKRDYQQSKDSVGKGLIVRGTVHVREITTGGGGSASGNWLRDRREKRMKARNSNSIISYRQMHTRKKSS